MVASIACGPGWRHVRRNLQHTRCAAVRPWAVRSSESLLHSRATSRPFGALVQAFSAQHARACGTVPAMSAQPTIKRMVLFKHGVAFVERGGPATGPFELSFKRDEMNDVLKSLTVWVAAGDGVLGAIAFEKPDDPERALEERRLNFYDGGALTGLFAALRGRSVSLRVQGRVEVGELVGVERFQGPAGEQRSTLVLRRADASIGLYSLAEVEGVELQDERSRADIEYVLDRNRAATAGETRFVRVDLRGTAADLRVSYVIPAPTWRVSYRVAIDNSSITIMGFGIVHNPADEDLQNVQLTLTTGQPVSFVIDLYHPKTIERTVVDEESRQATAPVRYARTAPPPAVRASVMASPMLSSNGSEAPRAAMSQQVRSMKSAIADLFDSEDPTGEHAAVRPSETGGGAEAAEGALRAEFFEYHVRAPVSLRRGGSAMVPLFSARGPAKKERIWRRGGLHPDIVLMFDNFTGVVLEEGPAVLYGEDVYAGEAMVPYSTRGASVRLGFAKDLAVRCYSNETKKVIAVSVSLAPRSLCEEYRHERTVMLTVENDHAEDVVVLFERQKPTDSNVEILDVKPVESSATTDRFRVEAKARGITTISFREVWVSHNFVRIVGIDRKRIRDWFETRFLDQAALDELEGVFALIDRISEHTKNEAAWEERRRSVIERMANITSQLKVLQTNGPEGDLRLRYVKELGEAQNEVGRCEASAAEFRRLKEAAGVDLHTVIEQLGSKPKLHA
jgi:hypothetical protein